MKAFLGIDVSKGYADFLLLDEGKKAVEPVFQLQDNPQGRRQLKSLIEKWFTSGIDALYCGVESTGGYERNWFNFLKGLVSTCNLQVATLNPKGVKSVSEAALKRTITDAVSAENIAVYLMSFPEKIEYCRAESKEDPLFRAARQNYSYLRMLQKQKTQLTNQLEKLVYEYFPEMNGYCRRGVPNWLLKMLIRYPSAELVKRAGVNKIVTIKGISLGKAQLIVQKATSTDIASNRRIDHVIQQTCKEALHRDELIVAEKQSLVEEFAESEMVKLLTSTPGIGTDSAVAILMEIENVNRFATVKKMAAYFGIHPTFKQSGDGLWKSKLSKKGRGDLRAVLYMCGLSGVQHNPILRKLYHRFKEKGMNHYQCMGVVMHKLLRIIYGILKNKAPFDPAVDEKNVSITEETKKSIEENIERIKKIKKETKQRYQKESLNAPISRRKAMKIKKQIASQTS